MHSDMELGMVFRKSYLFTGFISREVCFDKREFEALLKWLRKRNRAILGQPCKQSLGRYRYQGEFALK